MTPKAIGTLVFTLLSGALWLTAFYLLARSAPGEPLRTWAWAAGFTALVLTAHTLLYARLAGRKAATGAWFRAHGTPVQAEIVKISRYGSGNAWRIKACGTHPATGAQATYKSDTLRRNPNRQWRVGDTITVYLHPSDGRSHWMDTGIGAKNL